MMLNLPPLVEPFECIIKESIIKKKFFFFFFGGGERDFCLLISTNLFYIGVYL